MSSRYIAIASIMAVVGALPSLAQSVEEQLQRGIYTQQTAGDLDSAIRIFRQVIASNPPRKVYAAQAQVHLAQALLQKGDLDGAAREFSTLATNYSEFRGVIDRGHEG
jgi:outer membrane protein assembly factor BamD (BamD/ComL family)